MTPMVLPFHERAKAELHELELAITCACTVTDSLQLARICRDIRLKVTALEDRALERANALCLSDLHERGLV